MAVNSDNMDGYVGGDQREKDLLSSRENKHYDLINEKGDSTSTKSDMRGATKDMIVKELGHNVVPSSESATQSSYTLSTIINTGDNLEENSKTKSMDSSDNEIIIIDGELPDYKTPKQQNTQFKTNFNAQDIKRNVDDIADKSLKIKKKYDCTIDDNLPETVTVLTAQNGGKLYLIGTAHFSVESQNDVSKVIQAVQPHVVAVELCKARVGILQLDEEALFSYTKNVSYKTIMDTIKKEGLYNGLLHILLLRMAAHVAKQLDMPPGGEFRRAFLEAKKIPNCMIHLADRPINITIKRAIRLLSWWQTLKLGWHLAVMKDPITQEDVELCKKRSMLDEMIASMNEEFPVLGEVFVTERDIYLTNSLHLACYFHSSNSEPARVVGIVGLGHTPGIIENWGKVMQSDIPPIMRVPPPSLSSKILRLTVKTSILGAVMYASYKILKTPATITFQSIKSSVEGLLQVGATR